MSTSFKDLKPKELYTHPQEVWDEKTCAEKAKARTTNGMGTPFPYPGRIPQFYGTTTPYNGGCIRDGEWYKAEHIPLPKLPDSYEFYNIPSWGTHIRKKTKT